MAKKTKKTTDWLQSAALRTTRLHFLYVGAYMASIIVFDSWNLLTHEAVSDFWTIAISLLVLNTVFWYLARMTFANPMVYQLLILLLVVADIIFASLTIYWERGLASSSVILYTVPIITAAALRSRSTLIATATLCAAGYSAAAVKYFYQHYGESFRVELYGEIGLYSAVFFILVGLLLVVVRPSKIGT